MPNLWNLLCLIQLLYYLEMIWLKYLKMIIILPILVNAFMLIWKDLLIGLLVNGHHFKTKKHQDKVHFLKLVTFLKKKL